MHFRTHMKADKRGKSGQDEYGDGMVENDGHVGELLKQLDDLSIANDTIVFYSTDKDRITTKASGRLNSGQRSKQSSSDTARLLIPSKRIV
jgi:arylsulfatase A-like enzyme